MKLQLWIFFGNECAAASITGGCAVDLAGKTAVAQFSLHRAHVIVRRNQQRQRPVPLQFLPARDQVPYATGI